MFDLNDIKNTPPMGSAFGTHLSYNAAHLLMRKNVVVHGKENLPSGPAIFSSNHTHKFDFLAVRHALFKTHRLITWIKAREYNDSATRRFFNHCGNIPLASKGYVISSDFITQNGRRPTEVEYRNLRNHIDKDADLPDESLYESLLNKGRNLCGRPFSPAQETYAHAIRATYAAFMEETLTLARVVRDQGYHQQIYPQGAVSSQLSEGKTGAVQAALALDIPIVPMGVSGCIESFYKGSPFSRKEIIIKIGKPIAFNWNEEVHAFHHPWESKHANYLNKKTQELMNRINELLSPKYQWAPPQTSDAKTGIKRFI